MPLPIYYVGTPAEVEHHARPFAAAFDVRIEDSESVVRLAQPGDLCVFFNEFFPRYRLANHELVARGCPTLYAIDGILEWRNQWEFPPTMACPWTLRPILSHKIACIGRSQARILESWGHADQCEIVGVPRFDRLMGRAARTRAADEPFKILVLTAKCPGFTPEQVDRAVQSLVDLRAWLEQRPQIDGTQVRSIWRITQGLEQQVGVDNTLKDATGQDLADVLARVDAVITTPSTAMLEGMLQRLPVALLDYNNCPHYVPAAWRITAPQHFYDVIPELLSPPPAKVQYQEQILHDALECHSPALPRLVELIERMHAHAKRQLADGRELAFPPRMLPIPESPPAVAASFDYERLLPTNAGFAEYDVRRLQAEVGDLREAHAEIERRYNALVERGTLRARLGRVREKIHRRVRKMFEPRTAFDELEVTEQRRAA